MVYATRRVSYQRFRTLGNLLYIQLLQVGPLLISVDLFTTCQKVVHKGGSPNFKGLLFVKETNYLAQILQSLSYEVCSIILPKFNIFGLLIPILGTSAIMDQTACCYKVTTSEKGL